MIYKRALGSHANGPFQSGIKALIDAHADVLHSAAFGLGFSEADAEELVQDTFVVFLDARDRFEGRSHRKAYCVGLEIFKKAGLPG
ncbi:MAG: hypothetical protein A2992_09245 [Elusimicrobia bacterium RIFCSPLOWO2_01_FULL_59_12]|nr:MAG: hypothetical protein A2992_09245 [Elusimicrobia bacterium RIFCSPLOWO2_01_FULL_59_12]